MRILRILTAVVAISALTATLTFAGRDDSPADAASSGLETATTASGHSVPVRADREETDDTEDTDEADEDALEQEDETSACQTDDSCDVQLDEEEPASDEADADETSHCIAPDSEATDAEEGGDVAEPSHGAVVCGAAQAETPDGCENHGEYVRSFAQKSFDGERCGSEDTADATDAEVDASATVAGAGGADNASHGNQVTNNGNGGGQDRNNGGNGKGHGRP